MKPWIPVCASLSVSVTRTTVQFSVLSVTTFVIISYYGTNFVAYPQCLNQMPQVRFFLSMLLCEYFSRAAFTIYRYQQAGLLSFVWCYL